jgi:hypothetical protein
MKKRLYAQPQIPLTHDQAAPQLGRRTDATVGQVPAALIQRATDAGGHPLDAATRAHLEPQFGHDFSQVRIHADEPADEAARALNAQAFTVGQDVVFGAGRYQPDTPAGQGLLAHELTHVVQQSSGLTGGPAIQRKEGDQPDDQNLPINTRITRAIQWSSTPNYQEVCRLLNGLSIGDMLRQLGNIKIMGRLDDLLRFLPGAQGVFTQRLLAAIYAVQGASGPRLEAALSVLPIDQQQELRQYAGSASQPIIPDNPLLPHQLPPQPAGPPAPSGGTPAPAATSAEDNQLRDAARRALTIATETIKIERPHGKAIISVMGAMGALRGGGAEASGEISWGGTIGVKGAYRGFHLGGEIGDGRWELKFSYPSESAPPDLAQLGSVLHDGQVALQQIAAAASQFRNLDDVTAVQAAIKPHTRPLREAIQAFGDLAEQRRGATLGVTFGGPLTGGNKPSGGDSSSGFEIRATLTVVF